MLISEIFGRSVQDVSPEAVADRKAKLCPFRSSACTKSSITDPLGVCTLSDGQYAAAVCPVRFLERDRIFRDAANIAFGPSSNIAIFPEIRILRLESQDGTARKIGKVDFLIARLIDQKVTDFSAMEVQAVYFSGESIRPAMNHFLATGSLDRSKSERRPDFRSSAQKRLAPQLLLKVPVFRRWGKKFFVVVDSKFFAELPSFRRTTPANSELTWLSYPIRNAGDAYRLEDPEIVGSIWEDIANSLREGVAPEPSEILTELQMKLDGPKKGRPRILQP